LTGDLPAEFFDLPRQPLLLPLLGKRRDLAISFAVSESSILPMPDPGFILPTPLPVERTDQSCLALVMSIALVDLLPRTANKGLLNFYLDKRLESENLCDASEM
jgi:hypothetical protein